MLLGREKPAIEGVVKKGCRPKMLLYHSASLGALEV